MPGKNQRVRTVAIGLVVLLSVTLGAQGAVLQRASSAGVAELLDQVLPVSLRAWLAVPLPLKCGGTIDPNGGPCPAVARPASRRPAPRRPLPLKCGGTIEPNGGPCPAVQPHPACASCG